MSKKTEQDFPKNRADQLSSFLSSQQAGEESLDYISAHGFLTALAICPETISQEEWLPTLFGGTPDFKGESEAQSISNLLSELKESLKKVLESDALVEPPLTIDGDHEAELQSWSIGFVEGFFLNEEAWFLNKDEAVIAELTLPVMALSGLCEDELEELIENETQYESLVQQLPETLVDLYLLYRAPLEK